MNNGIQISTNDAQDTITARLDRRLEERIMFEVKFVDSEFARRNAGELISEYDMSLDSRHGSLSAAETRRKEIESNDPGALAWID